MGCEDVCSDLMSPQYLPFMVFIFVLVLLRRNPLFYQRKLKSDSICTNIVREQPLILLVLTDRLHVGVS